MCPSPSNYKPTRQAKASRRGLEESGESPLLDFDAIVDVYLAQSKVASALGEKRSHSTEDTAARTAQRDFFAQEILATAIVDGFDHNAARHLARISEAQMNRLIASQYFRYRIAAARDRSSVLRRLDLICALQERDAQEASVEYAGGDFDEYFRMSEDGGLEEIKLLETAAAMRAAGKWHLVEAGLRLEILENALRHYSNTSP